MCGIVYVKRKDQKPAYKSVIKRYRKQEMRGKEGYGYVAIKNNQIVSYERATSEQEIFKKLAKEDAPEILFHHRNPTSVPNIEEAAHPILVEHSTLEHQYFVAHNGTIRNSETLKEKHNKMGILYNTEVMEGFTSVMTDKFYMTGNAWNDTESIAIETALALDGKQKEIDTEGAAAVIGLQAKGKQVINRFFFRNFSNPLHYREDKFMTTLTSAKDGEEVSAVCIFKLKDTGGYEKMGDIPSPASYKNYHSDEYWENGKWVKNEPSKWALPSPRNVGFNWDKPTDKDIDDAIERGKRNYIHRMTYDRLWEEYNTADNDKVNLQKSIEKLDSYVDSNDLNFEPKIVENRKKLQSRMDVLDGYIEDLSDELTARESVRVDG